MATSPTTHRPVAAIVIGTLVVAVAGAGMTWRAGRNVNRVALAGAPRPVSFVVAKDSAFRASRTYVGSIEPWVEASVGPQYISAYVETVLVRPGDVIARGAVIATLDCSNPSASTTEATMQAHAIATRQRAMADEAARVHTLLDGGFVAVNESEQKEAATESARAQVLAARAKVTATVLDVKDCILRAPFDGEVATRTMDPGAFVHPGNAIVSVVDRNTVRVTADAPEKDFDVIKPGTMVTIDVLSTGGHVVVPISRRAPKADPATRTVRFEIDVADPGRAIPVATTGLVRIDVGEPKPATEIPLHAATLGDRTAKLFVIDGDVAHAKEVTILGESGGVLFVDSGALAPGTRVVVLGRALLRDGDHVSAKLESSVAPPSAPESRGGGSARPM